MTESTAPTPALRLKLEGPLAWIIADNPGRMNAYTARMWKDIPELIDRAERDSAVRVIVLRGAGTKAFSAGADISEFETARTGDAAKEYDRLNHEAFGALLSASKPLIAMIHGFCMGGGFGIAACCDLRLADRKSQFAIPAAKLGLGYNARWLGPLLALTTPSNAKELIFTGRRFPIEDAVRMGLVNKVCEEAELETAVRTLASEIAANAPLTIRAAKLAIDELTRHPAAPDMEKLDRAVAACFESSDYVEGRRAFLEKRKPAFKGH